MSAADRQNKLLVSEDWRKIYQTFRNADFQSYDFENLRRTMIDYLRQNYPEDYNDYIESSEFLALIDIIAFLGQSIAFRVDLNARENFLELAERRESVLRLSRMLGYNAKRNLSAQGLLKFSTISTTENLRDNNGRNLANQVITWNDSSNTLWYDQFITVLNAALSSNQQFGNPVDKNTIYGIPTEQYRFEGSNTDIPLYAFTKTVAGRAMNFEISSTTFKGKSFIYEEAPKIGNKLAFIYRNDDRGASSPGSGFFLNVVQGTLNTGQFTIDQPRNNETIDINSQNINNNDIWLYSLDSSNLESDEWTKVPSLEGNNVIYNSLSKNIRNIYSVITKAGDSISLAFSDGTFGNLPLGSFRVYYRISNGLSYTVNTKDIRSVAITVPYISHTGQSEQISLTLGLASSISNSETTESNDSIKSNAPATYYTQNRMITGEDYNISPLSISQQVAKIKSINRTSSGISRYFDLTDPTGKYSSTNLFATDGVIFKENYSSLERFSYLTETDIEGIIYNQVYDILDKLELKHFYYESYLNNPLTQANANTTWVNITSDTGLSTGYVKEGVEIARVGSYSYSNLRYISPGALVKFEIASSVSAYFDTKNNNSIVETNVVFPGAVTYLWAEIVSVVDDGTAGGIGILSSGMGPVSLNKNIPSGTNASTVAITQIIPKWNSVIDKTTVTNMINLIYSNKLFGLRYDIDSLSWKIVYESNLNLEKFFSLNYSGDATNTKKDASWRLLFTTDNEFYTIQSRELRYVFESDKEIGFYFDKSNSIYDSKSNSIIKDSISILNINTIPGGNNPYTTDIKWNIVSEFIGLDGYINGSKIVLSFDDSDSNGAADDPEIFSKIVGDTDSYIIQEKYTVSSGQEDYRYIPNDNATVLILMSQPYAMGTSYKDGQYFYFKDAEVVKKWNSGTQKFSPTLDYKVYVGRDKLKFQYTHSADYQSRIDPGASNIMDIYVLTKTYDINFRNWLNDSNLDKPLPPSADELHNVLAPSLNLIKPISDEIIFHPVNYKILFGSTAPPELQASFKVVKTPGQVVSDNDVKSRIISVMNEFFSLENWEFGDTFYFTEMSTYVINQLSPDISNFVIVPRQSGLTFGSLFEISSASDQLFINGATVNDIDIVTGITSSIIKSSGDIEISYITTLQQSISSSPYGSI